MLLVTSERTHRKRKWITRKVGHDGGYHNTGEKEVIGGRNIR